MKDENGRNYDLKGVEERLKSCKSLDDLLSADGPLKYLMKQGVESMLEAEMTHHLGYKKHAVAGNNSGNNRNGTKPKILRTGQGNVEIKVPQDRNSDFEPQIVRKYQSSSNEIEDKILMMYARGMTVRDIEESLKEMYGADISSSLISQITDKIIPEVEAWQSRSLEEVYPIVFLDAIHYKVRDEGVVKSKAAYIILGINQVGKSDILGIWINESEGANFWAQVIAELQNRGVKDILIACMDGLTGFPEAMRSHFPNVTIQKCIVHQIRNSLRYIASKNQKEFIADLQLVYKAPTKDKAESELLNLSEKWGKKYPLVIQSWEKNWGDLSAYFVFPEEIRKLIYTTNRVENFNRQLRKVTKNRSVFPTDQALQKLLYLATKDIMRKWNSPLQNWGRTVQLIALQFPNRIHLPL